MTTKIKVTNFDFDTIKTDFKSFLSTRPEFTDYNFEGSNLNVLLDVLAYNTHYHSLMANFLANEMFLDTAAKRSSVVSHAKTLGYVPKSKTAAKAVVNVDISYTSNTETTSFVLKKGVPSFKTNVDGTTLSFTTASNYSASVIQDSLNPNNYTVSFPSVTIYEGEYTTNTEVYNSLTKFISIPNIDVDLSTLVVSVRDPLKETYDNYEYAGNLLDVHANTKVYFVQEGFDGRFQIYFGDGVFGTEPVDKSIVILNYIITHGASGNGAINWILSNPDSVTMTTNYAHLDITGFATGGSDRESIASIKFNSINHFGTQNRAVVSNDYAVLAQQYSNNIKSVIAWGGEDDSPPIYNSVVLCAIPTQGEDLTDLEKSYIKEYLKTKAVASTNIIFRSPEYLDLKLNLTFTYDPKLIKLSVYELESAVKDAVGQYAKDYLYNFSGAFKQSKFLTIMDRVNDSITGTSVDISLLKVLPIQPFTKQTHVIDFSNSIDTKSSEPSIYSTGFYSNKTTDMCYVVDDRAGKMIMVAYNSAGVLRIIDDNIGKVDYVGGKVSMTTYVTSYVGTEFKLQANPDSNNIMSARNNILRIKNANITVVSKGE